MRDNVFVIDSNRKELYQFTSSLNDECNIQFGIEEHIADLTMKGPFKDIKRYFRYFKVPFGLFLKRKKINYILGWQQFYALIFCFYCSLFKVKKSTEVFALNFTYKEGSGITGALKKWFMNKCVCTGYLDYIHVPSSEYAKEISNTFSFPINKICVTYFGINDNYSEFSKLALNDFEHCAYYLSIGRSNRDYDFLIESWTEEMPILVIASDKYFNKASKKNVFVINTITADNQFAWINNCKGVIIPLDNPSLCSGDTVLLTSMSLKKIVIVTTPSALADMYIENMKNGILVKKKASSLIETIEKIEKGDFEYIKNETRDCFLKKYTRASMGKNIADFINGTV